MAVVINDFEVIVDPPAADQPPVVDASVPPPDGDGAAPPLSPADLGDVLSHLQRRRDRLRAH
jgi:hypothetical protein